MSSSTDELIIEEKNHVGLITLNRPKVDHLYVTLHTRRTLLVTVHQIFFGQILIVLCF